MAQRLFDDWEALVRGAMGIVPEILMNDVAPKAKHIMRAHIGTDIYQAYSPKPLGWVRVGDGGKWRRATYQRRGGLASGVFARLEDNSTLVVSSNTPPNESPTGANVYGGESGGLLRIIEGTNHGLWRGGFPRPAVSRTTADFRSNGSLHHAIRKGIENKIG